MKYAKRTALSLLLVAASALWAGACSSEDPASQKGQLVVVIKTDMQVPKDVSAVRLEVLAAGVVRHRDTYTLGTDGSNLKLPGTLTLVAGSDPSIPVKIRVIAFSGSEPKVLRETITTVPPDRVAMLPMPISWLCWDELKPQDPPEGQQLKDAEADCTAGSACVAGTCVASQIESKKLPDYVPENVYGGAALPGGAGACFDTLDCFAGGALSPVDLATCTVAAAATDSLNVGLVLQPGGQGICNASTCMVALDRDASEGWELDGSGRVKLPKAVCTQILDGKIIGVALSSDCATKTPAIPTCGPWSSVTSASGTFDGGASFDASNPCWISGSGVFCGSALGADPTKLYTCQDGVVSQETTCAGSCVDSDAGTDFCAGTGAFGQPCTATGDCVAGLTCVTADSGAIGGEGPARGICTLECTSDPKLCDSLESSTFAAPCVELGARDFCLESCSMGGGATGKCQDRLDVACAPVTLVGGTPATTCMPTCASDADCGGNLRCNFATGLCTTAAGSPGSGPLLTDCSNPEAGANACQSGYCHEYSDPAEADAGGGNTFGHCSARCRMGTPGACGFDGPVDGGTGPISACVTPAPGSVGEGDLGFCGQLCEVGCSSPLFCTTPAGVCKPWDDQSLQAKYGTSGYCVPYWEYPFGGC